MDRDILQSLATKPQFKKFSGLIRPDRLSTEYRDIYNNLSDYYKLKDVQSIDWTDFKTWYLVLQHPNLSDGKAAAIETACESLANHTPPENDGIIEGLATRHFASLISDKAYDVVLGKAEMTDLQDLFRQYSIEVRDIESDADSVTLNDDDIFEQLESLREGTRYTWGLPELDLMLGPIGRGDFILLGARPEGGKTTFLAHSAAAFARQLDEGQVVLWCNNEEPRERVAARRVQAALGWTREEIEKDPQRAIQAYRTSLGKDKIISLDKAAMTVHDIEAALEQFNPSVIIIDQLWKLKGFENEANGIDRYAKLAQYVRDLAKMYGPIIGASQLDATAENNKYPDMGSLYNSKTAVQGEADCIITIGQTKDDTNDTRYLRAPKNKLPYAHNDFRSAGCAVRIDKARAQYVSLLDGSKKHEL